MKGVTVFLAAGGTGGHLFPALSLARFLLDRGMDVTLMSDPRGTALGVNIPRLKNVQLPLPVKAPGRWKQFSMLRNFVKSVYCSFKAIRQENPDVVVGFGGYPSAPTIFAAMLLTKRIVVHEQNAVLGRVNRFAARPARVIATSFLETRRIPEKDKGKVILTGNPVRAEIYAVQKDPYKAPSSQESFRLFVMGGSQGARILSFILPDAIKLLPASFISRLRIVQQSRPELLEATREIYQKIGVRAKVEVFFHDVATELKKAHLVISRSGASSIFELMSAGRPAIFIPFAHAMDQHQRENARQVVASGGGWMFEERVLTPSLLSKKIKELMGSPSLLQNASAALTSIAIHDATERLAEIVQEQVRIARKYL